MQQDRSNVRIFPPIIPITSFLLGLGLEAYLTRAFGESYERYRTRVPRWL